MDSNLKNMIVLKGLPSNIIDEAIIVLKENVNVKELEKQKNGKSKNVDAEKGGRDKYVVKEAEMLVNNYVSKLEKKENVSKNKNERYMKKIVYLTSIISVIELIFLIVK